MSETPPDTTSDRRRLLVTAGPTHEPIDSVRYLGNRSSGRMGIALAEEAVSRGWTTTLLLGPTQLLPQASSQLAVVRFQTAAELNDLLLEHWPNHDVLLMAAAVADFRPVSSAGNGGATRKLRRTDAALTLTLEPTPDLLASLADQTRDDQTVIGFALEPENELLASASEKLRRKNLDAIVANPLETMDASGITATLLLRDGRQFDAPPHLAKPVFAAWLLEHVAAVHQAESA